MTAASPQFDSDYTLDHRYDRSEGRVYLTGTQALARILLDQAARDRAAGLNTAGFVSGYRGSPLGGVDLELWRIKNRLKDNHIEFLPAVNEDLAATAMLGSQQVETSPDRQVDGVFGLWYGKGPGVDRAGDALKHGNAYGSSPHGGVLVVAGDDHGCVSSSMPHQSDVAFMAWFMPTLNPASIGEYLQFGEYGYALSRYCGMWVGFKAISETVEAAASLELRPSRQFVSPDHAIPDTGLHYRWPDLPGPQIEERMEAKKEAVFAFAEANPVDRRIYGVGNASFGIVTTGKGHLDLMEAMRLLGLDEAACRSIGIDIYKVGMVWPLARRDALDFVRGKREVLVIEEKRGIIESQFKEYFYDFPGDKPDHMVGKRDEDGNRLVPWTGELSPMQLAPIVAGRLDRLFGTDEYGRRAAQLTGAASQPIEIRAGARTPYFCSGCPHNTSTKVPEGSKALAGIGCHFMASWMDRETSSLIQMGGEGVNWAASSKFTGNGHIFQNLGEGTWYHSGSMAIRQAIAAGANITYKILFNDAVAMTGGQPVDGPVSVETIAHEVRSEGVERIALVSDEPENFSLSKLPAGVTLHHRKDLDPVQRELREVKGVSVLIYAQTCATEKRRRRKRGTMEDPERFVVINDLVCEGCGDCSVQSNCLSVEPKETPFGRKRQINLSTCNKDFSCLDGFCPSFVTVEGAKRRKTRPDVVDSSGLVSLLDQPQLPALDEPYDLLVTGVGGTGVVTVGALITMAAHLENKGSSVLDFTGFAQKFGPVLSYIRIGETPDAINQVRIDSNAADALIGCDIVVASSPQASATYRPGMAAVLNLAEMPTGEIVRSRDADLAVDRRVEAIRRAIGRDDIASVDANALSTRLLGDTVFANVMMLGMAWQAGLVPVSLAALMRAIELNGVAVETNRKAFDWGRIAQARPDLVPGDADEQPTIETLERTIARREAFLEDYANRKYAERYRALVDRVQAREKEQGTEGVTEAVARSLFKLMAYKDEYEVARLHARPAFLEELKEKFEGDFRIHYHLAPPLVPSEKDWRGRPPKRAFGPWMLSAFRVLKHMKGLRGTPLDPFGYTQERRMERDLIVWYGRIVETCLNGLDRDNQRQWRAALALPMDIRGYGPVKQEAVARVRTDMTRRLSELNTSPQPAPSAAIRELHNV
ncbi:indolepyruvate ferredoxin oxidoreductase family protein [Hoeflea sp. WL0058]|uniref:Indolepyruvate ferredoxin oxidoreductase family protein n=1 Tax=Flavimaribacter sediminis TaxID=2865987 RepID=A0AAE2ZNL0_9HYPH|nr:indolepyruvate ferredoxin oxidoreductase family protein [Flavimaribacter sediminis]MBW8639269.1 indolepyruvate ferredoxin oxidoreductase family protein [Flavimaribacter sediminis]